ncbi:fatty acyl-CoA hydrolase precursor, medium chain-like isoform X5 [Pseudophryne corroboree]|uniref:fatty acyl-CoA hydrolase precursor, medium chain-like isoform X5 n=1 Tax=Pseudophryne corroboree TaxID=495146 RepID=UPI0030815AA6
MAQRYPDCGSGRQSPYEGASPVQCSASRVAPKVQETIGGGRSAAAFGQEEDRPLVVTQYGKLRGKTVAVKETDRTVHAFYGVPFAKPPVGPLRLASPEPPEPWGSVREATEQPPMCLQNVEIAKQLMKTLKDRITLPPVSEDCLYLNIFSPADREQNASSPAQLKGTSGKQWRWMDTSIQLWMDERLPTQSSGDQKLPENYGFLDQMQALRWVQGNIADFGGDPNSVTIFGESAGGMSASALMVSPLAKGHRPIPESGVATMPGLIANSVKEFISMKNRRLRL